MEIINTILHPVFTLAVRDGYIRTNPSDGAMQEIKKSHNWEKPKRHALTIEEQEAFIGYMAQSPIYNHWLPIFTVLLGTGCRIGELIGLRWCDCDFENNIISINHNLIYRQQDNGKCEMHITTPKTKAGTRTIPMLSEVRKALFTERKNQMQKGFSDCEIDGYSNFVFLNREGYVHNPMTLNRAIGRIIRDYNAEESENAKKEKREPVLIRHFSVHNLRHTFCTRFCENEQNLKVIQEIMGHSDISTTMNVYAEATEGKKQEAFKNLEGKLKSDNQHENHSTDTMFEWFFTRNFTRIENNKTDKDETKTECKSLKSLYLWERQEKTNKDKQTLILIPTMKTLGGKDQ